MLLTIATSNTDVFISLVTPVVAIVMSYWCHHVITIVAVAQGIMTYAGPPAEIESEFRACIALHIREDELVGLVQLGDEEVPWPNQRRKPDSETASKLTPW